MQVLFSIIVVIYSFYIYVFTFVKFHCKFCSLVSDLTVPVDFRDALII